MPSKSIYIGLISGTSLDGVDAVAVDFSEDQVDLLACHLEPYSIELQRALRSICLPGENEIDRLGELDRQVAKTFAEACHAVWIRQGCSTGRLPPSAATAKRSVIAQM